MKIEVKRFYMPGVHVWSTCPQCGERVMRDLGHNYLSYPSTGEQDLRMWHCFEKDGQEYEHEWTVRVRLSVRLEEVEGCSVNTLTME